MSRLPLNDITSEAFRNPVHMDISRHGWLEDGRFSAKCSGWYHLLKSQARHGATPRGYSNINKDMNAVSDVSLTNFEDMEVVYTDCHGLGHKRLRL